tara:strand:- start:7414 stop:8928 length:1515 start_codon:yes stop_codon:yes gene_type:complete
VYVLEPHGKTEFYFNYLYPNQTSDIDYLGLKMDGSMGLPLGNLIMPEFNPILSDTTNVATQLDIFQDHSFRFYDVGVSLYSKLRENVDLTAQVTSMSFGGSSLSKNILFHLNKKYQYGSIGFSYMYHDESIPTYYDVADTYNRQFEFYISGINISYNKNKAKITNRLNLQISNYIRPSLSLFTIEEIDPWDQNYYPNSLSFNYDINTFWNDFSLDYMINGSFGIHLSNYYKTNIFDVDTNIYPQNYATQLNYYYYSITYLSAVYNPNETHELRFGLIHNPDYSKPHLNYKINFDNVSVLFSSNMYGFINDDFYGNSLSWYPDGTGEDEINIYYLNDNKVSLYFNHSFITQSMNLGQITSDELDYYYFMYSNAFDFKNIEGFVNLYYYNDADLFLNNSIKFKVRFKLPINDNKFSLYAGFKGQYLNLNNKYDFDFSKLHILNYDDSQFGDFNFNVIDAEIGLAFKTFNLSFVRQNILNENYYYNDSIYIINPSNFLINIKWNFND